MDDMEFVNNEIWIIKTKGCFVRKDEKSQELFICTGEYSSDINSEEWQLLSDAFS